MNRFNLRLTVLLLLFVIQLTGCKEEHDGVSNSYKKDEAMVIGAIVASDDTYYQMQLSEYMKEAALEKNVNLELSYSEWNVEIQTQQIYECINNQVDAIIIVPVNSKSLLIPLKDAAAAGIPVINLNMKVDMISSEFITTYVGASMSEEAVLVGEMVVEALGVKGGKVAIVEGSLGTDPQIYRTQTFIEFITPYPEISIVGISNGDWDRDKAYISALGLLEKNPDIDIIYAQDSNMAMGVIRAVKELGYEDEVNVIGIGDDQEFIDSIIRGDMYGLVTQPPEYEGKFSVYVAVMAAEGKNLKPWYKNPVEKITQLNAESYTFNMPIIGEP